MNIENVRYHPSFVADLEAAIDYYDGISPTVGDNFRQSVEDKLLIISENPEIYATLHRELRPVRLTTFPYVILYEYRDDIVYFTTFVHGAADRRNWFDT